MDSLAVAAHELDCANEAVDGMDSLAAPDHEADWLHVAVASTPVGAASSSMAGRMDVTGSCAGRNTRIALDPVGCRWDGPGKGRGPLTYSSQRMEQSKFPVVAPEALALAMTSPLPAVLVTISGSS